MLEAHPCPRYGVPSAGGEELQRVDHSVGEAPLVVVPGDHLHVAAVDAGESSVEDGRGGVADDVGGDQRVVGVLEDAGERPPAASR
jgi:hypothetical protein